MDIVGRGQSSKLCAQRTEVLKIRDAVCTIIDWVSSQFFLNVYCHSAFDKVKFLLKECIQKQDQHILNVSLTYNYAERKVTKWEFRWM